MDLLNSMMHNNTNQSLTYRRWSGMSSKEKGIVLPLTALFLVFMIPMIGLAVDAGVLYVLKAKVQTSADAAAIAAARCLNVGLTLAAQETTAKNRALAFFEANFKSGSYGTKNQSVVPVVAETGFRTRTVTVTGSFDAPQYFMRFLGYNTTRVAAEGKASRRDVNLIIVLDRSGSMSDTSTNGQPCTTMRTSSTNFVNMFAEGRDRLSMILYGASYYAAFPPSMNFKTGTGNLVSKIASITCGGNTSTAMALWQGYQQLITINEPGALNLIVLFTDGYPNGVTADYPIKDQADVRYGYGDGYKKFVKESGNPTWYIVGTTTTCTSTSGTCTMEPSPCQDAAGNVYDRNVGDAKRRYNGAGVTTPAWNTTWAPNDTTAGSTTAKKLRGVYAQWAGDLYDKSTGDTAGIMKWNATDFSTSEPLITAAGCAFTTSYPGNNGSPKAQYVRRDIAYIPDQDIYGNNTDGYKAVAKFAGGHAYQYQKRVDNPMGITGASFNATDSAASRMRNDATIQPVIYTIGLGSNGGVDHEILRRISNDPMSPIYDDTKPAGVYVYAPTPTDLNYAFVRIASEILRIAQ
jgi:Flp pilus assembly protein TadG